MCVCVWQLYNWIKNFCLDHFSVSMGLKIYFLIYDASFH